MADLPPKSAIKPGETPTFRLIRITNRNEFPINDMFDGVPYRFEPNKPLSIPPEAAQHFFMWPSDDPMLVRLWIAKRLGWNTADDIRRQPDGRMRWEHWAEKIDIAPVEFDLVARDPETPIPADPGDAMMDDEPLAPPSNVDETSATHVGTRKRKVAPPPRRRDV